MSSRLMGIFLLKVIWGQGANRLILRIKTHVHGESLRKSVSSMMYIELRRAQSKRGASEVLTDSKVGDSVAIDGVCLTMTQVDSARFYG